MEQLVRTKSASKYSIVPLSWAPHSGIHLMCVCATLVLAKPSKCAKLKQMRTTKTLLAHGSSTLANGIKYSFAQNSELLSSKANHLLEAMQNMVSLQMLAATNNDD